MKYIIFLIFLSINILFSSELININFKNLKLIELIKITSLKLNKNILISNDIKGEVNFISNKAISKENLLKILRFSLQDNGYQLLENGDILRVVSSNLVLESIQKEIIKEKIKKVEIAKTYIRKNTSNIKKHNNELLHNTEVFFLTNIEVKSLEKILNNIISKRDYLKNKKPSISIDEESNSIIIDARKNELENLKNIILKLDISKSQVYVKAKIIEIDNNMVEDIGIKFGIFGSKFHGSELYTFASSLNGGAAIVINTKGISLNIPNIHSSLALGASLNLLNKTYALDIISEPSILCLNNKESSIYVGETISIQTGNTTTDGGTTKITFQREDIGLTLKVKPRISNDNKVLLNIHTILEGIKNTNRTNFNPITSKKEIITTAIVNNGESVIIGGLIERKKEKIIEKIPYVSEIPLIGELFKNRLNDQKSKNLVIIITPYIIPKNKDLTYVRNELSKLKVLENKFLENVLINLKKQKEKKNVKIESTEKLTDMQKHKQRLKEYFGI